MRVGQRLFLAVLPAIFGLLAVAGLAYFGEYARKAPEWLVVLAIVASLGSAMLAWRNTRYVALRIEQLASGRVMREETSGAVRRATALLGAAIHPGQSARDEHDELDRIERLLEQLTDTLQDERNARVALESSLRAREREYTALVDGAVSATLSQLEEVRLPLHILLENRFGDLNENQEEMLGAARSAAESADATLLHLQDVVRLDAGTLRLRSEFVRLQDVVASVLPSLRGAAGEREVTVSVDVAPALPAVWGDRGRLQACVVALASAALHTVAERGTLSLAMARVDGNVQLSMRGGTDLVATDALALPARVVRAHGGTLQQGTGEVTVRLPIAARPGDST